MYRDFLGVFVLTVILVLGVFRPLLVDVRRLVQLTTDFVFIIIMYLMFWALEYYKFYRNRILFDFFRVERTFFL